MGRGGIVRAYIHPGKNKSKELWPKVTVGKVDSPEDAVFADIDNDGAIDVISSVKEAIEQCLFTGLQK